MATAQARIAKRITTAAGTTCDAAVGDPPDRVGRHPPKRAPAGAVTDRFRAPADTGGRSARPLMTMCREVFGTDAASASVKSGERVRGHQVPVHGRAICQGIPAVQREDR